MLTFEELNIHPPLLKALADLEYFQPSPIQERAFPVIMSGRDMMGIAQTGTGKTFAYLLPILRLWQHSTEKHPRVLILVPTRELVQQVLSEIEKLSTYMGVRYGGIYGGANINTQKAMVFQGLDILVATPGRLIDLASIGSLKLKNVQKLVIDEVDEMLNTGFRAQLNLVIDMLPAKRQNILFSATLTDEVRKLSSKYFSDPQQVEVAPHGTPLKKIRQSAYHAPNFNTKVNLLQHLLDTDGSLNKVLLFAGKIKTADRLFEQMKKWSDGSVGIIHSRKSQPNRFAALKDFEEGKHRLLIATDVAARGLDIADVSHVINFDTPDVPGDYIHRIGRTGRVGKAGAAITFINEVEEGFVKAIEELMKMKIPLLEFPAGVDVSSIFGEDELPKIAGKNYLKAPRKKPAGAFHEKKAKNTKVQIGGPTKRHGLKGRSINRGVKRNRSKK